MFGTPSTALRAWGLVDSLSPTRSSIGLPAFAAAKTSCASVKYGVARWARDDARISSWKGFRTKSFPGLLENTSDTEGPARAIMSGAVPHRPRPQPQREIALGQRLDQGRLYAGMRSSLGEGSRSTYPRPQTVSI